jgi:hypothetical protein
MKSVSTFVVGLSFLLCPGIVAAAPQTQSNPRCSVSAEEAAVISEWLKAHPRPSLEVVVSVTESPDIDVDFQNLRMAAWARGVPVVVREDFKRKNATPCTIPTLRGENLTTVSHEEYKRLFRKGWEEFNRKYGTDAGITTFSRVGFNKEKTIALLHVESGIGPMAGGGWLYRLDKRGERWEVISRIQTWTT